MINFNIDRPFLGYAANLSDAIQIIQDTGIMCIIIGSAYILALFSLILQKKTLLERTVAHILTILIWLAAGSYMLFGPDHKLFSLKVVAWLIGALGGLALINLYTLFIMKVPTAENSSLQYSQGFPKLWSQKTISILSSKLTSQGILEISFINERILWLIILFRVSVTLRALLIMETGG